jgi:hypothetical protein
MGRRTFLLYQFFIRLRRWERKRSLGHHRQESRSRTRGREPDPQLKYDGIFQVVEDPKVADAYFKGMLGKWSQGGLDWRAARSTEISGSLTILDHAHQRLWFAAAVERDPLRLVAHRLFSRHPNTLAPHWVKAVVQAAARVCS